MIEVLSRLANIDLDSNPEFRIMKNPYVAIHFYRDPQMSQEIMRSWYNDKKDKNLIMYVKQISKTNELSLSYKNAILLTGHINAHPVYLVINSQYDPTSNANIKRHLNGNPEQFDTMILDEPLQIVGRAVINET